MELALGGEAGAKEVLGQAAEHGIDLGPLCPRLDEVINTESGKIELAPSPILDDLGRLRVRMSTSAGELLLIGRKRIEPSESLIEIEEILNLSEVIGS